MKRIASYGARAMACCVIAALAACGPSTDKSGSAAKAPATAAPSATPAVAGGREDPADRYDVGTMDFKPSAAVVSGERHSGAFAQGSALSMDAALKPLVADPIKEVRLDTTHNWDLAVGKTFPIFERLRLIYRAEAFNLTNRAQFSSSNLTPTTSSFGVTTAQSNLPRAIQMSLRLMF